MSRNYSTLLLFLSIFYVFGFHHQKRGFSNAILKLFARTQIYGPTYDALFKYVLSDEEVRASFLKTFLPNASVSSSVRLDDHMNPVQSLQLLRKFLHSNSTDTTVKGFSPLESFEVCLKNNASSDRHDKATAFLHEMVLRFDELKCAFPPAKYDGTMDFVCRLKNNEYALIEMQVISQNFWDRRALAYVAAFYGNQLNKGDDWKDIKKVIGINILGGGRDEKAQQNDGSSDFMRHYKMQEQVHNTSRFIDGIEIVQYSLSNAPQESDNQGQQDWLMYFKRAPFMNKKEVGTIIKTKEVRKAFKLATLKNLPDEVLTDYGTEDKEFNKYSEHTDMLVRQGKLEGKLDVALRLKNSGMDVTKIVTLTDLPFETITKL